MISDSELTATTRMPAVGITFNGSIPAEKNPISPSP